jgi:hypothetical protein
MVADESEGERFLNAFSALKTAVNDDPKELSRMWEQDERLQKLCDEISELVRSFEFYEDWSALPFTHHVSSGAAQARRDYDERWRREVAWVASRDLHIVLKGILPELHGGNAPSDRGGDQLADQIDDWKYDANSEAKAIDHVMDWATSHRDIDDSGDLDWVDESIRAWDRLKACGLDLAGALWRKRAVPHVLVPTHVAKHYGKGRASLYRRLHEAARAFIFGAPLAAIALQRAILEEVLRAHWGARERMIESARLPELSWDARAARLKRMANEVLHSDPERQTGEQLERAVIENFLLLRLLIENAPEKVSEHIQPAR